MDTIVAAVMPAPHAPIELREFPRPDLPPGGALLDTLYSEVCGTDVHLWHGRLSGVPYPIIPGHVSIGTLAAARGQLDALDGTRLKEGDRVVFFDVHRTCGRCYACTVARTPTRCPSRRVYGITDPAAEGLLGGWAEMIYLEPGVAMAKLPDDVTPEAYIGGGCGLLTAVHIIERANVRPGDRVVVQGIGAVGLSTIALARLAGASRVIGIGGPDDRTQLAHDMGADLTIGLDATTPELRASWVLGETGGRGADIVIEAAGSPRAVEEGFGLVRDGGVYVIAGHYTNTGSSTINAHEQINRKHLDIRGCWGSEVRHFMTALTMLERHAAHVPWERIGATTFGLDELNEALADAEALKFSKALVKPRARGLRR
jgi:D-arabinose 1-dehydrogenase-like Zn-dependent alcohol dehydrogenase